MTDDVNNLLVRLSGAKKHFKNLVTWLNGRGNASCFNLLQIQIKLLTATKKADTASLTKEKSQAR